MSVGIDLVHIPEFLNKAQNQNTLEKIFATTELGQFTTLESRAGIFAAKEACMKALGKKIDWQEIWVQKQPSGKPYITSPHIPAGLTIEVSISHSGEYATAIVIIS